MRPRGEGVVVGAGGMGMGEVLAVADALLDAALGAVALEDVGIDVGVGAGGRRGAGVVIVAVVVVAVLGAGGGASGDYVCGGRSFRGADGHGP